MRTVRGVLLAPPDAPPGPVGRLLVEVRDVSLADAPSVVVAQWWVAGVELAPGSEVPFALAVPEAEPGRTLALRGHASRDGSPEVAHGDLITTTHVPLTAGDVEGVILPLRLV